MSEMSVKEPEPAPASSWQRYRLMIGWASSALLSALIFGVIFVWHRPILLDAARYIAGAIIGAGLINVYGPVRLQKPIYGMLAPWFALSVLFALFAWGYDDLQRELTDTKVTLTAYRDTLKQDLKLPYRGGQPETLHRFLLGPAKAREVRILGINATGLLHGYRQKLERIVDRGGRLKILLLDPQSEAFKRRERDEKSIASQRIRTESHASIAILSDIVNHLLESNTLSELEKRFQIRLHDTEPERSILSVDRDEPITHDGETTVVRRRYLLMNRYPECLRYGVQDTPGPAASRNCPRKHGQASVSLLVDPNWTEYGDNIGHFDKIWKDAEEYDLSKLIGIEYTRIARTFGIQYTDREKAARSEADRQRDNSAAKKVQYFRNISKDTEWRLIKKVALGFKTHHPQGLVKIGNYFYLSSVDVEEPPEPKLADGNGHDTTPGKGTGYLFKFDNTGKLDAKITLGEGNMYHPGGIDYDGEHIWVPVAEYRRNSQSIIYRVNPSTLRAEEIFRFPDHIGAVVHNGWARTLHGANWGARRFYTWTLDALLTAESKPHPDRREGALKPTKVLNANHYIEYQDCQYVVFRYMVCSGLRKYSTNYLPADMKEFAFGGIDLIDLQLSVPIHQISVPIWIDKRPDLVMTNNPFFMEVYDDHLRFYFVPEDEKSQLYIYDAINL